MKQTNTASHTHTTVGGIQFQSIFLLLTLALVADFHNITEVHSQSMGDVAFKAANGCRDTQNNGGQH